MNKKNVVIIGGGPAGIMAGIRSAESGNGTTLLERNPTPGRKLDITGNGLCNITHEIESPLKMSALYGENGKFLISALSRFGPAETVDFFHELGIKTVSRPDGRVFPAETNAVGVRKALLNRFLELGGILKTGVRVLDLKMKDDLIDSVLWDGGEIHGSAFILATGGKSYPSTGSTGDGYTIAEKPGHTVIKPEPGLVPLTVDEKWPDTLQGLSLKDRSLKLIENDRIVFEERGDILFTGQSLSGPAVLNVSRHFINREGGFLMEIDLFPDLSAGELDSLLISRIREKPAGSLKNTIAGMVPERLACSLMDISGIDCFEKSGNISASHRKTLTDLMKSIRLRVRGTEGFERAVITRGGIDLAEIDPKTMGSLLAPNLFFAGEIMDLDGPTGGYNLQICWSTGHIAGICAGMEDFHLK